jgi:hypothetical protein
MTSNLGNIDSEATYRREQLAEDFRRAGGRERGVIRPRGGRRWHLHRDHRASR